VGRNKAAAPTVLALDLFFAPPISGAIDAILNTIKWRG
jgi:hypothetical protein